MLSLHILSLIKEISSTIEKRVANEGHNLHVHINS